MSAASSSHRRRSRPTREQLQRRLKMLAEMPTLLPAELPPSPHASSRSGSPAVGSKRKADPRAPSQEFAKRARTGSALDDPSASSSAPSTSQPTSSHHRPSRAPQPSHLSVSTLPDQVEDPDATRDQTSATTSAIGPGPAGSIPLRRPKRSKPVDRKAIDSVHKQYFEIARLLKWSAEKRYYATFPSKSGNFRPLQNPPPPNSPYHIHSSTIARIELLDAILHFVYAMWCRDNFSHLFDEGSWDTLYPLLALCQTRWAEAMTESAMDKAFIGLLAMIRGYIKARAVVYRNRRGHKKPGLKVRVDAMFTSMQDSMTRAAKAAAESAQQASKPANGANPGTPQMLPSPASIAEAKSTNSTPTGHDSATPNAALPPSEEPASSVPTVSVLESGVPLNLLPEGHPPRIEVSVARAMMEARIPLAPSEIADWRIQTDDLHDIAHTMQKAETLLNLPILARNFPRTFTRATQTCLLPGDEWEVEFDDNDGELFWPTSCATGEGLGWVVLLGRAMLNEFASKYGYVGLDGCIPKPPPPTAAPSTAPR
ncbi:hypothetical protein BD626DRAFT_390670 [Schizophyllum amplum]|uniref:Uncharacterized protein n=1 Tax=Schizophyllum amplum TaxID=97359 RepID=A0A550CZ06_9AGAR|nr:hypothetical protein BD626DRAFT_390670 [Auriculariopsis ampla]